MRRQMEGSAAVAETVARCRPEVVAAYPISPQTHIVEALSAAREGGRAGAVRVHQRRVRVRRDVGVAIGASATGARAYTATASQGLLFMAEASTTPRGSACRS